jgi:type I restriction enzyme S subunit
MTASNWPRVRLKDLGTWFGGGTPSKANRGFWTNGTVPWLSPKDMGSEVLAGTQDHITQDAVENSSVKRVPAGSVAVVVRSGILERTLPVALVPFDTTLNQDMKAVVARNDIDARWIAWGLRASEQEMLSTCRKAGTTVASMEMPRLYEHTIPVPPLEEQQRIVDILEDHLSRLDAGVRGLGETVERIRLLKVSSLVRNVRSTEESETGSLMFGNESLALGPGWTSGCLAEAAEIVEYGTSSKTHAGRLPGDIPVLRMGNIKDGRLLWGSLKYLAADHPGLEKLMLLPGDLLFNRTNSAEHVGKSAVFEGEQQPATFASYLIRVRFRPHVDPRWTNMVINSRYGRGYVTSVVSQQVGQANVNGTKLKSFPLPIPTLDEQISRITRHEETVDRADRLLAEVQTATQRLQSLRRSLLAAAFTGRLTGRTTVMEIVEEMAGV